MNLKGKKVLVTGAAGFIGSDLVHRLVQVGAEVIGVDALLPECGGNITYLENVATQIDFVKCSIDDASLMKPLLKGVSHIFNLAGTGSHSDSMQRPLDDLKINATSQLAFLMLCQEISPGAPIVYASTRQLYGRPQYLPVDEKHPLKIVDFNAVHKLSVEHYHQLCRDVYGMRTVSLRLTNTYGPRLWLKDARLGFMGWFINNALSGKSIQLFGGGDQLRDFNYVGDVSEAFILAATSEKCFLKDASPVFNLAGERASLVDIANQLIHLTGKGSVEKIPFPAENRKIDIGDYYGTHDLFTAVTGWKPVISIHDGLQRTIAHFQKAHQ